MEPIDRPDWMGLLSSTAPGRLRGGVAPRGRTQRNVWVVAAFFALVLASLIGSLM